MHDTIDHVPKREAEEKLGNLLREEEIKWTVRAKVRQVF